jgi:sec-independent protein translocase protein TatA
MPFGGMELLIILVIILLFFGAKRVPELGRSLGRSMREFRREVSHGSDDEDELRERRESGELPRQGEARPAEGRDRAEQQR